MAKVKVIVDQNDQGLDLSNLDYTVKILSDGSIITELEIDSELLNKSRINKELLNLHSIIKMTDNKELKKCYNELIIKHQSNG
jgi:hypothetical protein